MSSSGRNRRLRLLILDEDRVYAGSLVESLQADGYDVTATGSANDALTALAAAGPELLLADVNTSGPVPAEFLRDVRRRAPGTVVVLIAAYGSVEGAVAATRGGAFAYLTKPAPPGRVRPVIDRAARQHWLLCGYGAQKSDNAKQIPASPPATPTAGGGPTLPLRGALAQSERQALLDALRRNAWNRQAAAAQLGIDRATLYKKVRKYGLAMADVPEASDQTGVRMAGCPDLTRARAGGGHGSAPGTIPPPPPSRPAATARGVRGRTGRRRSGRSSAP